MRRTRTIPLALASLTLGLAGCNQPPGEDPSLLFDRAWVDSQPEKPTDYMHATFLLKQPAIGVFQRASSYDLHAERFDHEHDGKTLKLTFPQTGKTAEIRYTITACNTLPPYDL
ncbi:MAG: hypothetical protein ACK4N5_12135, partial [Myxococcales bacterium]